MARIETRGAPGAGGGVTVQQMNDAIALAVANLVNGAPANLNTLGEIAAALTAKGNPGYRFTYIGVSTTPAAGQCSSGLSAFYMNVTDLDGNDLTTFGTTDFGDLTPTIGNAAGERGSWGNLSGAVSLTGGVVKIDSNSGSPDLSGFAPPETVFIQF